MNTPARESRLNRAHLIVTIVTSLIAAALGVFGFVNQNKAQDRGAQVQDLSGEVESFEAERDALEAVTEEQSATIADLENTIAELTGGETMNPESFIELADAVDTRPCTDGGFYGEWTAEGIELSGEQYWNGFACVPYHTQEDEFPVGHADFLVPADATQVTGMAGFDDRSADSTMTAEFLVHSVPEGTAPLFSQVIAFGEVAQIEADVTGLDRVRFEVRVRATDYIGSGSLDNTATPSWVDMKFA